MDKLAPSQPKQKIRILCLHGYMTNAKLMEYQLKQWREVYFKKNVEFICINGLHELPQKSIQDPKLALAIKQTDNKVYSWFSTSVNFLETFEFLEKYINENGPFDGILGFSQGGHVVHSLLLRIRSGEVQLKYPLKFAIFICNSFSEVPTENSHKKFQCSLPTLHLIGDNDFLYNGSMVLTTFYSNPKIIFHNAGHKIPRLDIAEIQNIKSFMKNAIKSDFPLPEIIEQHYKTSNNNMSDNNNNETQHALITKSSNNSQQQQYQTQSSESKQQQDKAFLTPQRYQDYQKIQPKL